MTEHDDGETGSGEDNQLNSNSDLAAWQPGIDQRDSKNHVSWAFKALVSCCSGQRFREKLT